MFFHKPIDQVTVQDLRQLEQFGTMENRRLEFKRQLPENLKGDGKWKFFKAITAFANTDGGTILYGVDETPERTAKVVGFPCTDPDGLKNTLTTLIERYVEPKLYGYQIEMIQLENGLYVLGIDVPKSWNAPHAVRINDGTYRFHVRKNTSNVTLDALDIRELILANMALQDKIRGFLEARLVALATGETPAPLHQEAKIILHLIPVSAFQKGNQIDISTMLENRGYLHPLGNPGCSHRINLEGLLGYYEGRRGGSYIQVYRNGIIESVETSSVNREYEQGLYVIPCEDMVRQYIQSLRSYLHFYQKTDIHGPIYGFFTLQGVKEVHLPAPENFFERIGPAFGRDTLRLPEMVIEDLDTPVEELLKVPMDALWNAGGFLECPYLKSSSG